MRKIWFLIISLFVLPFTVHASSLIDVTVENCSNNSSFWVNVNGEVKRVGLLAFDTGNSDLEEDILNYICNKFENASKIQIEYDDAYTNNDEYNRDLVWIYVDGELLQKDLISRGYGRVNYVSGNYSNLSELCKLEKKAFNSNLGIWALGVEESYCSSDNYVNTNDLTASLNSSSSFIGKDTLKCLVGISSLMILLLMGVKRKGKNEKE